MRRREMLGVVGSGSLAMAAVGSAKGGQGLPQDVRLMKDPRTSCYEQCESLAKLCLIITDQLLEDLKSGRGDAEAIARLHGALADSREFCSLVVTMVLRDSPFRGPSCVACAEVFERCTTIAEAATFESKEQVVEQLKECAAVCLEVAGMQ